MGGGEGSGTAAPAGATMISWCVERRRRTVRASSGSRSRTTDCVSVDHSGGPDWTAPLKKSIEQNPTTAPANPPPPPPSLSLSLDGPAVVPIPALCEGTRVADESKTNGAS